MTTDLLGIGVQFERRPEVFDVPPQSAQGGTSNILSNYATQQTSHFIAADKLGQPEDEFLSWRQELWHPLRDAKTVEDDLLGIGSQFENHQAF